MKWSWGVREDASGAYVIERETGAHTVVFGPMPAGSVRAFIAEREALARAIIGRHMMRLFRLDLQEQELYRAIPKDRELILSHSERGIFFRIVDRSQKKIVQTQQMSSGTDLLRAGIDVEKVFFLRLRGLNAEIDKELSTSTKGER